MGYTLPNLKKILLGNLHNTLEEIDLLLIETEKPIETHLLINKSKTMNI